MECLLAALARRGDPPITREVLLTFLKQVRIPEVRAFCIDRLIPTAAAEVGATLADYAGGKTDDASFALRQVPWLPPVQRAVVVRAALQNPAAAVRARAVAWQKTVQ